MSNKKILISTIVAVIIIGATIYYIQNRPLKIPSVEEDSTALDELNQLLDAEIGIPDIKTTSANPLGKVAPTENPIDKTNPFKNQNDYQNPFE